MDQDESKRPILYLVHGTSDGARELSGVEPHLIPQLPLEEMLPVGWESGDRWWQIGGNFLRILDKEICTKEGAVPGDKIIARRFIWDGENSELRRRKYAERLAAEFLSAGSRPIYVVAHSHGGNIVRMAVEMALESRDIRPNIKLIVSLGTAFFIYSKWYYFYRLLVGAAFLIFGFAVVLFATFFLKSMWLGNLLVFAAVGPVAVAAGQVTWAAIKIFAPKQSREYFRRIKWKNYYSEKDEAIIMLSGLNSALPIARETRDDRTTRLGIIASVLGMLAWAGDFIGPTGRVIFLLVVVATYFTRVWFWSYEYIRRKILFFIDANINVNLRVIAYGDDVQAGIVGVRTHPWAGFDDSSSVLSAELDQAVERYIESQSKKTWVNLRRQFSTGNPLIMRDIRLAVMETLKGDALAHTVYFNVNAIVSQVAREFAESDDWLRQS